MWSAPAVGCAAGEEDWPAGAIIAMNGAAEAERLVQRCAGGTANPPSTIHPAGRGHGHAKVPHAMRHAGTLARPSLPPGRGSDAAAAPCHALTSFAPPV